MGIFQNKYVQAVAIVGVAFLLWKYYQSTKAVPATTTTTE